MIDLERLARIRDWTKKEYEHCHSMAARDALAFCKDPSNEAKRYSAMEFNSVSIAYRGIWESLDELLTEDPSPTDTCYVSESNTSN